jgi:hypothetical protein
VWHRRRTVINGNLNLESEIEMKQLASSATAGIGAGLLIGWSLGVSGIAPGQGTPMWIITAVGIVLMLVGGLGIRKTDSPPLQ